MKFNNAKGTTSVGEAKQKGASAWELVEWHKKGRLVLERGTEAKTELGANIDMTVEASVRESSKIGNEEASNDP